jgi:superfamily II DNA/RNA helicase
VRRQDATDTIKLDCRYQTSGIYYDVCSMNKDTPTRDELAAEYFEQLPFDPYPVQEEALLAWFTAKQGVLVCAPTGTGKTLIAEAAVYEALRTGRQAYYTTPLIALTEQKLQELQESARRWGFDPNDIGLVTGNRRVNPDAPVLVVVAEILLNRLLHSEAFDFNDVSAVVMDEFHSFNDPERGIVWEFGLGLLPGKVRTLLLSATVGNSVAFVSWLRHRHQRGLDLVQSDDRKVPLTYQWVGDELLSEHIEKMAAGDDESRLTPALIFCFNREECWNVAEQLKGKGLLWEGQKKQLTEELDKHDWTQGAGPKLKRILMRGVGVHHAGVMPRYRRIVEELFQQKLLTITVCTETLAAGINLPARSVVIPNLLKGPPDKKKVIEASAAHQMFGRAGRPQFDTQGYVFVLAHEDDVKIQRWREKYDVIPEDTKDPGLRKAKKALKKKMPTRRTNQQYWTEGQFEKLCDAAPTSLSSRGHLPWRMLAFMLQVSPELSLLRELVSKRLLDTKQLEQAQKELDRMLMILWRAGYVELDPEPPKEAPTGKQNVVEQTQQVEKVIEQPAAGLFSLPKAQHQPRKDGAAASSESQKNPGQDEPETDAPEPYRPEFAYPTEALDRLLMFRGVNPLYGVFLINQLGAADRAERIQAMESVLDAPGSFARLVRVPSQDDLPPGPLATTRLDVQLLQLGLASPEELGAAEPDEDKKDPRGFFPDERVWVLKLADKLKMLFDHDFPGVHGMRITPVWAAGDLLDYGGDFNKYVTSNRLQKQEGMLFRHLLRLILLIAEFRQICPPDTIEDEWNEDLDDIADRLEFTCREVDLLSTDKTLESAKKIGDE